MEDVRVHTIGTLIMSHSKHEVFLLHNIIFIRNLVGKIATQRLENNVLLETTGVSAIYLPGYWGRLSYST